MAGAVFVLNIPFGFWRARTRKFSRNWFLAIHIPVLVSIGLKLLAGIGFALGTFPLFVGVFFIGQLLGGRMAEVVGAPVRESDSVEAGLS